MIRILDFLKMFGMCMCKVLEIEWFRDFPLVNDGYGTMSTNAYTLGRVGQRT